MRNRILSRPFIACTLFFLSATVINAQSTGYINRQATVSTGRAILDPNGDIYTSATSSGFGSSDVTNSELPYRSVPSFSTEPFGDLRRGPDHNYSDFVPDANSVGYYAYYDGTNLLFRFRMGSIMSGSKGYSVLLDTDGKFGATGANADPDYQPATTGTNGNPGFEIEVVLETNFRIAIYNVAGSSSATLVKQYTNWQDMSQVSIAGTFDNGDPDFFIDFYIPFSDLTTSPFSLTTSSSLRMSATTVMSPQAAIGGPKSDIYGLTEDGYTSTNDQYEAYINAQPSFTVGGLTSGGFGSMCTAAPTLNTPITTGATSVSGTWTKTSLTGAANTATIKIYKNGAYTGNSVSVSSGGSWTVTGLTALASNDVITAKAVASGESECLSSNSVTVSNCNSSNRPSIPVLSCYTTSKGITGTNLSTGWTIHVDNLTRNTQDNSVTNSSGLFGTPTGSSPNLTWAYSNGCTSGSPMTSGSYKVYYTDNTSGCASEPAYVCVQGNGGNALATALSAPTITSPSNSVFTTGTTSITGTTDANANLYLYVNGSNIQNTTATSGGAFTFSNLNLISGQQLYIVTELNTGIVSTSKCAAQTTTAIVTCYTSTPLITVDNNNQITAGQPITGTSSEPAGTTIKVYTSGNTLVSTVTVQSGGTWTTGAYTAVNGTSYYATAQNGGCGVSTASGTATAATATSGRCGAITGPVSSSDVTVSGTITGSVSSTTVNLYLDDILIGSTTTNNTAWSISVSNLYNNGVLKIGVQESGKQEQICTSSATTITCSSGPVAPSVTPTNSSINAGQTQTYTISNAVTGAFYGISDASTGASLGTGVWATSSTVNLTTTNLSTNSYTVSIKGTSLSGVSVCSSSPSNASLLVSGVLPLNLLDFTGHKNENGILLEWATENEIGTKRFEIERSYNGTSFNKIGEKPSQNSRDGANYDYFDARPLAVNYYRLKMVDEDGKYTYSKVIVINQKGSWYTTIQPNPFQQSFTANIYLPSAEPLKIQLLDINGRLIRYKSINGVAGTNKIEFNDIESLQPGIYMVRIVRNEAVIEQKLIKANR